MSRSEEAGRSLELFEAEESFEEPAEVPEGGSGMGARLVLPAHGGRTLAEAQEEVRKGALGGTTCGCCGGHVRVYRRRLNAGMAYAVARLAVEERATGRQGHHLRQLLLRHGYHTGDYCYLVHWKVLSRQKLGSVEEYATGHFRLTARGMAFARGEVALPAEVLLFGKQVLGFSRQKLTLHEALGQRFKLEELLGGATS
jgi:hypothetical protein